MTADRTYRCDLCRDSIYDYTAVHDSTKKPGIGIRWAECGIEKTSVASSEHHLCLKCLVGVHRIQGAILAEQGKQEAEKGE